MLLAQRGEEHLANAVLRRGTKGEYIVCWGDRILQWDVAESAEMVEVFSPIPGFQYSNGGCVMDGDGVNEIIASEAEIENARLGIFKRDPAYPDALWEYHEIDTGLYCPHSLVLADVDNDGSLDIIVGEMTAGGWSFPLHENPRIMAYINHGDYCFKRVTLVEGWGVHEMGVASGRRDGKVLIYAADEIQPQKFPGMNTHVSYWTIE